MTLLDPHASQPLLTAGPKIQDADGALILLHGRSGSAEDILTLYEELNTPNLAAIAPQAQNHTWYPNSFLAPIPTNQPFLDSALARIESLIQDLIKQNIPSERIAILGFSQGACLATEFAARHPRRYAAIMALTGGLIGPPGTPRNYPGNLDQTPVFLGANDPDPHVPFAHVQETQTVLKNMGAITELRRYPNMPHTIIGDEIEACQSLLQQIRKP